MLAPVESGRGVETNIAGAREEFELELLAKVEVARVQIVGNVEGECDVVQPPAEKRSDFQSMLTRANVWEGMHDVRTAARVSFRCFLFSVFV